MHSGEEKTSYHAKRLNGFACLIGGLAWLVSLGVYVPLLRGYFFDHRVHLPADLACFRDNGAWLGRHLESMAPAASQACTYKYPPPFLLIATPLSWGSAEQDFVIWSAVSVAALILAARLLKMSWNTVLLGLIAPPTLLCLSIGESGILLSALLLLALGLVDTAPIAAGIAGGAMIVKPQLGLLLPVCYAASRNWRAFLAAGTTVISLCVLTTLLFGGQVWADYLHNGLAATRNTLAAPWPQRDQHIMVTPYIFLHSLGMGFAWANMAQIAITFVAAYIAWHLWRAPRRGTRLPATLCLAALATPFACLYDLSALAMALAAEGGSAFFWFWIFSSFYLFVSVAFISVGALCLAGLFWLLW